MNHGWAIADWSTDLAAAGAAAAEQSAADQLPSCSHTAGVLEAVVCLLSTKRSGGAVVCCGGRRQDVAVALRSACVLSAGCGGEWARQHASHLARAAPASDAGRAYSSSPAAAAAPPSPPAVPTAPLLLPLNASGCPACLLAHPAAWLQRRRGSRCSRRRRGAPASPTHATFGCMP